MRQIDTEELKAIQLEILDVVMKFCDEHNINCWLDFGTLLGAVRHKGYIPWDDDIDIGMLRPDYDKFLKIFNENNTRYKLSCIENDPSAATPFGKVYDTTTRMIDTGIETLGINIDIWVHDNAPDDEKLLADMYKRMSIFCRLYGAAFSPVFYDNAKGNFLRRIIVRVFRIFAHTAALILPKNYFARKIAENSKRYAHEATKRIGVFVGAIHITFCAAVKREALSEYMYADFEGRRYKIPAGYDEWLRALYGDYMRLPPEEERNTHHYFIAFVKD